MADVDKATTAVLITNMITSVLDYHACNMLAAASLSNDSKPGDTAAITEGKEKCQLAIRDAVLAFANAGGLT